MSETPSGPTRSEGVSNFSDQSEAQGTPPPARIPWWIRITPFFLSGFFFLSAVFVLFSPLPLLFLHAYAGRRWAWVAALTNGLLVAYSGGLVSCALFAVFVLALGLAMPEFVRRKWSLEKIVSFTLLTMFGVVAVSLLLVAAAKGVSPVSELKAYISLFVDQVWKNFTPEMTQNLEVQDPEEVKRAVLVELPGAVGIFSLVLVWANLTMLLRLNPASVRQSLGIELDYFKNWKAPEFLVWPTIVAGAVMLFDSGVTGDVATNVFKFLMAVYAIQGLSLLSFLFDVWNVRGIFRTLGFLIVIFLMMPLLLSLGFFDLWFDFRGKLRQS